MDNLARIAVIGTGWWATDNHIPGLLANPDAFLAANLQRVTGGGFQTQIEACSVV